MTASSAAVPNALPNTAPDATHLLDRVSLGKIVQIREALLQAQAAGRRVFRLESGDPSFAPPAHVLDAMRDAAVRGQTHYPPNGGIPAMRAAARRKLERVNGTRLDSDEAIFVTNGAMHALYVVWQALLDHGDEVIVPDPMWTEAVENVRLAGGVAVPVPLVAAHGYRYEADEIARRITPRTRAIFLNTPHNPTGAVLAPESVAAIVALAAERGLWVVSDEAYEDVLYAPNVHRSALAIAQERCPAHASRVVAIYSFSKSHAMSGLRVGYVVTTDAQLQDRLGKIMRCTINGVNTLAQWGAAAALDGPRDHIDAMNAEYAERRDLLLAALDGIDGVRPFAPQGAFYVWAELEPALYRRLGVANADGVSQLLAEAGVGSAPGDAFGEHSHDAIRFAFSCDTAMVREGAERLRALLTGAEPTVDASGTSRAAVA